MSRLIKSERKSTSGYATEPPLPSSSRYEKVHTSSHNHSAYPSPTPSPPTASSRRRQDSYRESRSDPAYTLAPSSDDRHSRYPLEQRSPRDRVSVADYDGRRRESTARDYATPRNVSVAHGGEPGRSAPHATGYASSDERTHDSRPRRDSNSPPAPRVLPMNLPNDRWEKYNGTSAIRTRSSRQTEQSPSRPAPAVEPPTSQQRSTSGNTAQTQRQFVTAPYTYQPPTAAPASNPPPLYRSATAPVPTYPTTSSQEHRSSASRPSSQAYQSKVYHSVPPPQGTHGSSTTQYTTTTRTSAIYAFPSKTSNIVESPPSGSRHTNVLYQAEPTTVSHTRKVSTSQYTSAPPPPSNPIPIPTPRTRHSSYVSPAYPSPDDSPLTPSSGPSAHPPRPRHISISQDKVVYEGPLTPPSSASSGSVRTRKESSGYPYTPSPTTSQQSSGTHRSSSYDDKSIAMSTSVEDKPRRSYQFWKPRQPQPTSPLAQLPPTNPPVTSASLIRTTSRPSATRASSAPNLPIHAPVPRPAVNPLAQIEQRSSQSQPQPQSMVPAVRPRVPSSSVDKTTPFAFLMRRPHVTLSIASMEAVTGAEVFFSSPYETFYDAGAENHNALLTQCASPTTTVMTVSAEDTPCRDPVSIVRDWHKGLNDDDGRRRRRPGVTFDIPASPAASINMAMA